MFNPREGGGDLCDRALAQNNTYGNNCIPCVDLLGHIQSGAQHPPTAPGEKGISAPSTDCQAAGVIEGGGGGVVGQWLVAPKVFYLPLPPTTLGASRPR